MDTKKKPPFVAKTCSYECPQTLHPASSHFSSVFALPKLFFSGQKAKAKAVKCPCMFSFQIEAIVLTTQYLKVLFKSYCVHGKFDMSTYLVKVILWKQKERADQPLCQNHLSLKSDQHLISPYSIIPKSYIKVTRITEMINKYQSS